MTSADPELLPSETSAVGWRLPRLAAPGTRVAVEPDAAGRLTRPAWGVLGSLSLLSWSVGDERVVPSARVRAEGLPAGKAEGEEGEWWSEAGATNGPDFE